MDHDPLYSIETYLYKIRLISDISIRSIFEKKDIGVSTTTIFRIERHNNYNMQSLLNYAEILGKYIIMEGTKVKTLADIGLIFKNKREQQKLTLLEAYSKSSVIPRSIINIERGKNYSKNTFLAYMSIFKLKIEISE